MPEAMRNDTRLIVTASGERRKISRNAAKERGDVTGDQCMCGAFPTDGLFAEATRNEIFLAPQKLRNLTLLAWLPSVKALPCALCVCVNFSFLRLFLRLGADFSSCFIPPPHPPPLPPPPGALHLKVGGSVSVLLVYSYRLNPSCTVVGCFFRWLGGGCSLHGRQWSLQRLGDQAKRSTHEAQKNRLARVPDGTSKSDELSRARQLIWSFDLARPKTGDYYEIQVIARKARCGEQTETLVPPPPSPPPFPPVSAV